MKIDIINEKSNLKKTSARQELFKVFYEQTQPISYEDIKETIHMDKTTFYRNVSKFERENFLNSFESNNKKRYYEIKTDIHAHFICDACNSIECLREVKIPSLKGYKVVNSIFKGTCKDCNK